MNNKKIFKKTMHATFAATAAILLSSALLTNNQSVKAAEPAKTTDMTAKKTVDSNTTTDAAEKKDTATKDEADDGTLSDSEKAELQKADQDYANALQAIDKCQNKVYYEQNLANYWSKNAKTDDQKKLYNQALSDLATAKSKLNNANSDLEKAGAILSKYAKKEQEAIKKYGETHKHDTYSADQLQKEIDYYSSELPKSAEAKSRYIKMVDKDKSNIENLTKTVIPQAQENLSKANSESEVEKYAQELADAQSKLLNSQKLQVLDQNTLEQETKHYQYCQNGIEEDKKALNKLQSSVSTDDNGSTSTSVSTDQPNNQAQSNQSTDQPAKTDSNQSTKKATSHKKSTKTNKVYLSGNGYKIVQKAKFHTFKGLVKYAQKHNFSLRFNHAKKLTVKHLASYYKVSNNSFKRTRGFLRRNKKVVVKRVAVIHGRAFAILNNGKAIIANKLW